MPRFREREDYPESGYVPVQERRMVAEYLLRKRYEERLRQQQEPEMLATQQRIEEKSRQVEEKRWLMRYYEKKAPEQFKESVRFYTELGYPRLAGRYAPFELPVGYGFAVQEKREGLEVTLLPSKLEPEVPSLAERISQFDIWQFGFDVQAAITGRQYSPRVKALMRHPFEEKWARPQEVLAGIIAYPEALTYTVGRLAGFKTPSIPSGFEVWRERPGYTYGYVLGMVGTSFLIGEALAKTPVGRALGKFETKVMEKVTKPVVGTRLDKWLYAHSQYWRSLRPIQPQVVGAAGTPLVRQGRFFYPSWGMREAAEMSWMLETTPRASALSLGRPIFEAHMRVYRHLIFREGALSIGFVSKELGFVKSEAAETTLLRLSKAPSTAITLLRMAKAPTFIAPFGLSFALAGFPHVTPKLKKKAWIEPYSLTRLKMFPQVFPRERARQRAMPFMAPRLTERLELRLSQKTLLKQQQVAMLVPPMPRQITATERTRFAPLFFRPGRRDIRRMDKGLFGRWFKRMHPIKSPEQLWRSFYGKTQKPRGTKRRVGRRR